MDRSTFCRLYGLELEAIASNSQTYGGKAPLVILRESIAGIPFFFKSNEAKEGEEIIHVSTIQTSPMRGASTDSHLSNHMSDDTIRPATATDCGTFRLAASDFLLAG